MPVYEVVGRRPQFADPVWIAPNATIIGTVHIAENSCILWNAVVRGDDEIIRIGANSNVQDGSVLHADPGVPLTLGDSVTVGHMAMLHGCTIGDGSLIGIKSVIMNKVVIGKECLIGANTLIPEGKVIPDRSLVVGSPGRILRTLTDEEVAGLYSVAAHYVKTGQRYRDTLTQIDGSMNK
jgi:carbonic anhydrase/acetyltransferase-like protein (isoleucine patch superfamily)